MNDEQKPKTLNFCPLNLMLLHGWVERGDFHKPV